MSVTSKYKTINISNVCIWSLNLREQTVWCSRPVLSPPSLCAALDEFGALTWKEYTSKTFGRCIDSCICGFIGMRNRQHSLGTHFITATVSATICLGPTDCPFEWYVLPKGQNAFDNDTYHIYNRMHVRRTHTECVCCLHSHRDCAFD